MRGIVIFVMARTFARRADEAIVAPLLFPIFATLLRWCVWAYSRSGGGSSDYCREIS